MRVELQTTDKVQEIERIREEAAKLRVAMRCNKKVQPRAFQPGDLVWRDQGEARKNPRVRKLGPNWEGFSNPTSAPDRASSIKW